MVLKIFNFLFTLFRNKDFISQEAPIFADFENTTYYWIKILGAVVQWYSQRTSVIEVAGSIPAPVIVELR